MMTKERKKAWKSFAKKFYAEKLRNKYILIERIKRDVDAVTALFLVIARDEKELREVLKRYPLDGVKITPSAYDCTGRFFCDPAEIRKVCDGRFFVKINGYYDV